MGQDVVPSLDSRLVVVATNLFFVRWHQKGTSESISATFLGDDLGSYFLALSA